MTRQRIKGFFIGLMAAMSTVALAATFDYFSPATGILVGTSSTYVTTAATSSNVISLWTGTCNNISYLRGDGACTVVAGANPTASVGLTATNGVATTFMRSDAAPPISQAIAPTWTGIHKFTNSGGIELENPQPSLHFHEVDAAADEREWHITTNGGRFFIQTLTDAGGAGQNALNCDRTGTTVGICDFTATGLTLNTLSVIAGTASVAQGGTGLTSGTSGGLPYFNSTTTMASSALLTANALLLGGGAGAAPNALGSLGSTTTVLHGNAAGAPTFGAVSLTADVSGILPVANGGTNLAVSADDNVMVGNATTWETKAVPDCDDSGGNHLNYDTGTNAFSCGTTATTRFARASITCTGAGCSLNATSNAGISSVTRNSAGNYTVNFSAGFTDEPICVGQPIFSSDFTNIIFLGTVTTTTQVVLNAVQGTAMTTTDTGADFTIFCQGL